MRHAALISVILSVVMTACSSGCGSSDETADVHDGIDRPDVTDSVEPDVNADAGADAADGWTDRDAADVPADADTGAEDVPPVVNQDFFDFAPLPTDCIYGAMCEIAFKIDAQPDNPYDPAEVAVDVEVVGHGGYSFTGPAFYYQGFTDNDGAPGSPDGPPEWRFRFQPATQGQWYVKVIVTTAGGRIASNLMTIEIGARPPESPWHFYVRRSAQDRRYLSFQDGTPYFPVGENMCWWNNDVTDYTGKGDNPGWMQKLADSGGNFIRLWMATWGFSPEWSYPEGSRLGDYGARQDRAWALDRVFERADRLGLMVQLCMFSHGQFSTTTNSEWATNPYNTANGGFLDDPRDFFTDPEALRLTRNRLRYIVARWGAEPALLAWELFNEIDLTDPPDDGAQFAVIQREWHKSMAGLLKTIDTNLHMVTSSISSFGPFWGLDEAIFGLDDIDFVQVHHYGNQITKFDIISEVPGVAESYARFDKPVFFAELGVHSAGPVESLAVDPSFIGLHDLIWAPVFGPSAGSGMTWWWDNLIEPNDQYFQFKAMADFVSGINWHFENFAATTMPVTVPTDATGATPLRTTRLPSLPAPGDPELTAFALVGQSTTLVWVKNTSERYWEITEATDPAFIEGATLDLSDLPAGNWTAQWFHTFGYTNYPAIDGTIDNTVTALPVPGFSHDIALRLQILAL